MQMYMCYKFHIKLEMLSGDAKALHTTHRSSGVDVSDPSLSEAWDY